MPGRPTGTAGYPTRPDGGHPRSSLGDAHDVHEERVAPAPRPRRRGIGRRLRAPLRRGRGALARDRAPARLRLRDPPDARQAPAGRRADPARGGIPRRARRGRPLPRRAPGDAARHAPQEDPVRVRRALGLRPRVRARPPRRHRDARAEVGAEEAPAAVLRGRSPPRGGLPRRRGARTRSRRARGERDRVHAPDRRPARAADRLRVRPGPAGVLFRRPTLDDADATAALIAARDFADFGERFPLTGDELASWWRPDAERLATDAWIALRDGAVVGFARMARYGDVARVEDDACVHPAP